MKQWRENEPYAECPECREKVRLTTIRGVQQTARHLDQSYKVSPTKPVCAGSNKPAWVEPIEYREVTRGAF